MGINTPVWHWNPGFGDHAAEAAAPPEIEAPATSPNGGVPFLESKTGQCQWFMGDEEGRHAHVCGLRVKPGKSYCPKHYSIVYLPMVGT